MIVIQWAGSRGDKTPSIRAEICSKGIELAPLAKSGGLLSLGAALQDGRFESRTNAPLVS